MSTKYLGQTFDIHGGGIDNLFPHNECEIAQAEAATGEPFSRYWLLTGTLTIGGVKMSKSLGNFVTISDALERIPAEALRFFILSSHYRSPIDFSVEALEAARKGWQRLVAPFHAVQERLRAPDLAPGQADEVSATLEDIRARFCEALSDDFNAPVGLTVLFDLARVTNTMLHAETVPNRAALEAVLDLYQELGDQVLGILPAVTTAGVEANREREAGLVRLLIELRARARQRKDFAQADSIRVRLHELGIILQDGKDGTTWRIASG
jgi:cysteinyl-tRNA synthetase